MLLRPYSTAFWFDIVEFVLIRSLAAPWPWGIHAAGGLDCFKLVRYERKRLNAEKMFSTSSDMEVGPHSDTPAEFPVRAH